MLVGFENNFNGTTFHHHFCVKIGVKCPEDFFCHSLAPETYSVWGKFLAIDSENLKKEKSTKLEGRKEEIKCG